MKLLLGMQAPYLASDLVTTLADLNVHNFTHPCFVPKARSSRNPQTLGETPFTSGRPTRLVIAVMGPADPATPSVTQGCVQPKAQPQPSCALPIILVKGCSFPFPAQNIAWSFPRVQDQRLPLHTVPGGWYSPRCGLARWTLGMWCDN